MKKENILVAFTGMSLGLLIVFILLIPAYMEARTFNKFSTDKKASVIDAIFAELRVEGCR